MRYYLWRHTTNSHRVHPNSIECFDAFFCHKCLNFSVNINMESCESDLSDDMYFVKIIKSFDSNSP